MGRERRPVKRKESLGTGKEKMTGVLASSANPKPSKLMLYNSPQHSQPSLLEMSVYLWREALVFDSITQARCGVRGWQMGEFGSARRAGAWGEKPVWEAAVEPQSLESILSLPPCDPHSN